VAVGRKTGGLLILHLAEGLIDPDSLAAIATVKLDGLTVVGVEKSDLIVHESRARGTSKQRLLR
jgi:hypothetical protein